MPTKNEITEQLKQIIRTDLKLGDVELNPNTKLAGGEFDLDSLDLLLVITSVERAFSIKIPNDQVGPVVFENLQTLTDFIASHCTEAPA